MSKVTELKEDKYTLQDYADAFIGVAKFGLTIEEAKNNIKNYIFLSQFSEFIKENKEVLISDYIRQLPNE